MSGGGGQEVYCCDEHGRPYVIRTIDGIRKPIAITSSFLRHILKNVKDSSEKKLIDRLLKAMEAGRANLKSFFDNLKSWEKYKLYKIIDDAYSREIPQIKELLRVVRDLRGRFEWAPPISRLRDASIAREVIDLLRDNKLASDIEDFLANDLEELFRGLDNIGENEKKQVREAVLLFMFESVLRKHILENATRRGVFEEAFKDAVREYLHVEGSELERILNDCNRDIIVFLMGSSAKYSATPESDVEVFLYTEKFVSNECRRHRRMREILSNTDEYRRFRSVLRKVLATKIGFVREEQRDPYLVDLRIGTLDLIKKLAESETSLRERERGVFWTYTPVVDGLVVGRDRKRAKRIIDGLADKLDKIATSLNKGNDLFEWGLKQYRESISILLGEPRRIRPEEVYRYFDLLTRGIAIKRKADKEEGRSLDMVRKFDTKPYWLLFDRQDIKGTDRLEASIKKTLIEVIRFRAKLAESVPYSRSAMRRFYEENLFS